MNKTILITGASSGIGKATELLLYEKAWVWSASICREAGTSSPPCGIPTPVPIGLS